MTPRTAGFSLVELLIVLAILGILLRLSFGSYVRWQRTLEVVSFGTQLSQDVLKARSLSKRYNTTVTLAVTGTTTYTLSYTPTGGTVTTLTKTAPAGTSLTTSSASLAFNAPFGTVTSGTLPLSLTVQSQRDSTVKRTVKVLNLFGATVLQ